MVITMTVAEIAKVALSSLFLGGAGGGLAVALKKNDKMVQKIAEAKKAELMKVQQPEEKAVQKTEGRAEPVQAIRFQDASGSTYIVNKV